MQEVLGVVAVSTPSFTAELTETFGRLWSPRLSRKRRLVGFLVQLAEKVIQLILIEIFGFDVPIQRQSRRGP